MYKVSIGIPVYNVAAYVERALLSALNQTLPDIEYIIIDDRGTDNSMDIVRRIISEHPRGKDVRIIEQEVNKGIGVARDTMLAKATAPYIYFMDSDDEITGDAIERLYSAITETDGVQVVQGNYETVFSGGSKSGVGRLPVYRMEKNGVDILRAYPDLVTVVVWNRLYDSDFLKKEKIGFGGVRRGEDLYFSMQVACKARRFIYIPHVTYFYYENVSSLSADFRARKYDGALCQATKSLYGKLLDYGSTLEGEIRSVFEKTMLEILYCENRYALRGYGLSYAEKKKFLEELNGVWRTFTFQRKYRDAKAKIFWAFYRLPIPLRMVLIRVRNLFV